MFGNGLVIVYSLLKPMCKVADRQLSRGSPSLWMQGSTVWVDPLVWDTKGVETLSSAAAEFFLLELHF